MALSYGPQSIPSFDPGDNMTIDSAPGSIATAMPAA